MFARLAASIAACAVRRRQSSAVCEPRPATVVCGRLPACHAFLSRLVLTSVLSRLSATTEYPCCQGPGSREELVRRGG